MMLKNLQLYTYVNGQLKSLGRPSITLGGTSTPSAGFGLAPFGTSPFGR